MKHREVSLRLRIPQPEIHFSWRDWLPARGNVAFTLVIAALLVLAQSVGALPVGQAPTAPTGTSTNTIAYQGRLADAGGSPLTGTYSIVFRLYSVASGGAPLWEEQWTGQNGVSVSDGLFNIMLGSLTPIPQSTVTDNNTLWLGITVGTDDEMAPRVQLGSVPFAVQALTVPDASVTTARIADGAVTQVKLGSDVNLVPPDGSITTAKLADASVTTEKLVERAVTNNKLDPNVLIKKVTPQSINVVVQGTKPNYVIGATTFTFSTPFPNTCLLVMGWLNVNGGYLGVPVAPAWTCDRNGFAFNSTFYYPDDIVSAGFNYVAIGY